MKNLDVGAVREPPLPPTNQNLQHTSRPHQHDFPPLRVLCTTSFTTDSRSDHVRIPVARPLWIPAFAGMTVVMHSTPSLREGDAT